MNTIDSTFLSSFRPNRSLIMAYRLVYQARSRLIGYKLSPNQAPKMRDISNWKPITSHKASSGLSEGEEEIARETAKNDNEGQEEKSKGISLIFIFFLIFKSFNLFVLS